MAICSAKTVEESFALLVAVYYVFNLVMCKHLMKTLVFMLKYACNIDDPVRDSYILRAYKQCLILVEKLTLKHQSKNRAGGGVVGGKRSCESEAVSVTKGKGQMFPHGKDSENDNKENEGENNNKERYERSEGKVCRPTAAKRARGKAKRSNKSGNGDYYFY